MVLASSSCFWWKENSTLFSILEVKYRHGRLTPRFLYKIQMKCVYPSSNSQHGNNLIYIVSQMKLILNNFSPKKIIFTLSFLLISSYRFGMVWFWEKSVMKINSSRICSSNFVFPLSTSNYFHLIGVTVRNGALKMSWMMKMNEICSI